MRLNFQTHGTGFPLLILHGLFGSLDNWHTVSLRLAESWQVFALDLRNHGRSPHSDVMDYELMAADVAEFLRDQQLPRAHVLGHSLGGKVAMQFALHHPGLVEKLVVEDIAPKAYPPYHLEILAALRALDLTIYKERREVDAALAPAIPDTALRQFLLKNVARDESGAFSWKMNLEGINSNYDQLGLAVSGDQPFTVPALFIKGGRSDYLLDDDQPAILRLFPRAKFHTIAGVGHWVHAKAPEEFIRTVGNFLHES